MKKNPSKFARFMQNNIALLVIVLCMAVITTIVLVVALTEEPNIDQPVVGGTDTPDDDADDDKDKPTGTPDDDVVVKPTITVVKNYFDSPVEGATAGMQFTSDELLFVFNETLNCWKTHNGLDLVTEEATKVTAMQNGTVIDVNETFAMGNSVVVDHGEGVIATYASLSDVAVVVGQTINKGDSLGKTSASASNEYLEGIHLHLEVAVDGTNVDPTPYVNGEMFFEETVVS